MPAAASKRKAPKTAKVTTHNCQDPSDSIFLRKRRKRERDNSPHLHESKHRSAVSLTVPVQPSIQPDQALRLATKPNDKQLQTAQEQDQEVLRKHLPAHVSPFLTALVAGPGNSHEPPLSFLHKLQQVVAAPVPTPTTPPFRFNTSNSALCHNEALLRASDLNIEALLSNHQNTTLGYRSKFRPVEQLRSILGSHPHFAALEVILREGID
jgi:hypothetical protein